MFENKYGKFITVLFVVLIILIIGGLIYLGYNVIQTFSKDMDGENAAEKFENQFMQNTQTGVGNTQSNSQVEDVTPDIAPENDIFGNSSSTTGEQEYKGFTMVGTINIPKINLKCPILKNASAEEIEVAVGIYSGPGLNKVGNTVIAGHNYRNGTFFSDNKKLSKGDKVYITDGTGTKVAYTIYNIYTTSPQDSEYLNRNTNGKREISLTTCTDDTNSRLIIWATAD